MSRRVRTHLLRLVAAAALAALFAPSAVAPARAVAATPVAAAVAPDLGLELMRLTNLDRVANGLAPLRADPTLAALAASKPFTCPSGGATHAGRAADMAAWDDVAHEIHDCSRPDGTGYTILDILYPSLGYNTFRAENIAWNTYAAGPATYTSGCDLTYGNCRGISTTVDQRVMAAERGFIRSPSHRSNVLGDYDRFGCGVATSMYGAYFACLFSLGGPGTTAAVAAAASPAYPGVRYQPVAPARIVDSRSGLGLGRALTAQVPATFAVAGLGGIPAGAIAVTGNLTVTGVTGGGYVSLSPVASATPGSSTLNLPAGDTRANGVTLPLDPAGHLAAIYVSNRPFTDRAQLVFDVTGYFAADAAAAGYVAVGPVRLVDSRAATGGVAGPLHAGSPVTFRVAGSAGVPANAVAVTGNLTITGQTASGYLALTSVATSAPTTSTVNAPRGDTRANNVVAPLGAGGTLSVVYAAAAGATAQVVFDVTGAFVPAGAGAAYVPLAPTRAVDTREALGLAAPLRTGVYAPFAVARAGVPAGAVAVTGNATIVQPTAGGWVAISPSGTITTSSLNFPTKDIRANGAISPVTSAGTSGAMYGAQAGAGSQFVFDVTGYFR